MSTLRLAAIPILFAAAAACTALAAATDPPPPAPAAPPAPVATPQDGVDPDYIPPAFRAARHDEAGEKYLRALPDGTKVIVDRADGAHFELKLAGGKLTTTLPASQLDADGHRMVTTLGYELRFDVEHHTLFVAAPNGRYTLFMLEATGKKRLLAAEQDGGQWATNREGSVLRLPDGARIDTLDNGTRWELITLRGERFSLDWKATVITRLADLPSPPLIPAERSFYLSGDGDDWRVPVPEDHVVFAWSWVLAGLPLERAIKDVSEGFRRADIDVYFNDISRVQPAADDAAAILGRRLCLVGGDRLTFDVPGREPATAFIFPGPLEPDYAIPRGRIETNLGSPHKAGE